MSTTIARLYESRETATEAAEELRHFGFSDSRIHVISNDNEAGPGSGDAVLARLRSAEIPRANARAYAEGVRQGGTLVMVQAPYGTAGTASTILERFNPTRTTVPEPQALPERDVAAPFSAWMRWRVLLPNNPTPLSDRLGLKVLSDKQNPNIPVFREPAPFSRLFGWRLLTDNPAPLSTRMGWRLLLDDPTPLSRRYRWPVLRRDDPTPLSRRLGWRVLSEKQNPSISLLHDPAPFSRLFGWRVLLSESKQG